MRHFVIALLFVALSCSAHAQRNRKEREDASAIERACTVGDCFNERDVRSFEVIDKTHVIVYVGSQRCPFRVEVQGVFCDLTFAHDLFFRKAFELPQGGPSAAANNDPVTGAPRSSLPNPFEIEQRERQNRDLRVCDNDISVEVYGGEFTDPVGANPLTRDRLGNPRLAASCKISGVTAITDDQLLEFFVSRGVLAPPPPMGPGEIEVGIQRESESSAPPEPSDEDEAGKEEGGRQP